MNKCSSKCNKMWFDRQKDAETYIATTKANKYKSQAKYANIKLTTYLCKMCGKWHITSAEKLKGKKLKIRNSKNKKRRNAELT